ncbi:MAG: hypothetical protein IPH93_16795 [Saprospiraceae bacterium]|nr:hypothetical protein [Saprospiraceae bacterium]MBK7811346.1 hypothetical protein [Saprospiraceae bacterium]MBK9631406.1 hypothetical protein [Saprospiraceae bacterium]
MNYLGKVLFVLLFLSCEKDNDDSNIIPYANGTKSKVEGQVIEYGSNKPIPGAKVILQEGYISGSLLSGRTVWTAIDTFVADNDGKYQFEFFHKEDDFDRKELYAYEVYIEKDQYFPSLEKRAHKEMWTKNLNFVLDPFAWIKVHIKNVNPFDDRDYLFTSSHGGGGDYRGKNIDNIEFHINRGNRKVELYWNVKKNSIFKEFSDSLYLPAHDTVPYEINY